jgi:hypothetical protein
MTTDDKNTTRDAYVDLLKRSLLGLTLGAMQWYRPIDKGSDAIRTGVAKALRRRGGSVLAKPVQIDMADNTDGSANAVWIPPGVMTMIGSLRLQNVEDCVRSVLGGSVAGDLIETGVWRGGTTIFMRGMLRAFDDHERAVYVADSFAGLPPPDPDKYPADEGIDLHLWSELAVTLDEVRANFSRYGLLDDRVHFVKGWFRDTLPSLQGHQWALIRLDGDLYESTMDGLTNLYPGLSPGGWIIIDDYQIPACQKAVSDYRDLHGITEPIQEIDWTGICWQKRR